MTNNKSITLNYEQLNSITLFHKKYNQNIVRQEIKKTIFGLSIKVNLESKGYGNDDIFQMWAVWEYDGELLLQPNKVICQFTDVSKKFKPQEFDINKDIEEIINIMLDLENDEELKNENNNQ